MRQPLPEFLGKQSIGQPVICECHCDYNVLEIVIRDRDRAYSIHCINPIDYAIRPVDPRLYWGVPPLQWSADDPKLLLPRFQYVPGGDGERFDPPRRWQIITINQTYVVAGRFEIERITDSSEETVNSSPVSVHAAFVQSSPLLEPINWESLGISFKDS